MNKWETGPIDAFPSKTLDAWRVCVVHANGHGSPTTHLWGFVRETCRGRVSTAISRIDPISRRILTRSGRVYQLAGDSGVNTDALCVWASWKQARGTEFDDEVDVTDEVEAMLARHA